MKDLNDQWLKSSQRGFTLVELLIVLVITGLSFSLGIYGTLKLKQVIEVSNATKEIALNVQEARRFALDSVVTKDGYAARAYYIEFDGGDYFWGECGEGSGCKRNPDKSMKSLHYQGIDVDLDCGGNSYVKFLNGTGEFIFTNSPEAGHFGIDQCTIRVKAETVGGIQTERIVMLDAQQRTIKMESS